MADPWTIAIDTRERKPLKFDHPNEKVTLATGDYSIVGFEDRVAIERKSLNDLINTLIHNRERFEKELERFRSFQFKCIIVESDLKAVFSEKYRSKAHPMSIVGLFLSLMMDYDIPVLFCSTKPIAAKVALSFLHRAHRRLTEVVHV